MAGRGFRLRVGRLPGMPGGESESMQRPVAVGERAEQSGSVSGSGSYAAGDNSGVILFLIGAI